MASTANARSNLARCRRSKSEPFQWSNASPRYRRFMGWLHSDWLLPPSADKGPPSSSRIAPRGIPADIGEGSPSSHPGSGDGVLCVLPHLGRTEGEHDLRLRNAGLNQLRGDAVLGVVFLNPHLA